MAIQVFTPVRSRARALRGVAAAGVLLVALAACSGDDDPAAAPTASTVVQGEVFVGATPIRVLDTRQEGFAPFGEGEARTLSFADRVPATATSVSLAIVAPTGATSLGYFTMWPTGETRPNTSVLNPAQPYDLATSVLLRLGAGRSIDIYNAFGQADLVVDLLGYFLPQSAVGTSASGADGEPGPPGPPGTPGTRILSGNGPPAFSVGSVGDFYLDTSTAAFYGPKTTSGWQESISLAGSGGSTASTGSGMQVWQNAGAPTADAVTFPDGNAVSYGADPPTLGGGLVTITTPGTYRVSYTYAIDAATAAVMQVTHNGAAVPGSDSISATTPATYHGQAIVQAAAGDTVGLQFPGLGTPVGTAYGSMLVERVA